MVNTCVIRNRILLGLWTATTPGLCNLFATYAFNHCNYPRHWQHSPTQEIRRTTQLINLATAQPNNKRIEELKWPRPLFSMMKPTWAGKRRHFVSHRKPGRKSCVISPPITISRMLTSASQCETINPFYSIKVAYSADDRFDFQHRANLLVMVFRS